MGWKNFNDRLALFVMALLGALLFYLVITAPQLRDKVLTLIGPWGTFVLMYYFRKKEQGPPPAAPPSAPAPPAPPLAPPGG